MNIPHKLTSLQARAFARAQQAVLPRNVLPPQLVYPQPQVGFTPPSTWSSNLGASTGARTGQISSDTWATIGSTIALAGTGLGAYHGYKRTGNVGWAVLWGLLGGLFPIVTIPVAIAQGFGKAEPSFHRGGGRRARDHNGRNRRSQWSTR